MFLIELKAKTIALKNNNEKFDENVLVNEAK